MSDRDLSAIATWERMPDGYSANDNKPAREPPSTRYLCVDCKWHGGSLAACKHHAKTGHAVRGVHWPPRMANAQFKDAGPDGRRK